MTPKDMNVRRWLAAVGVVAAIAGPGIVHGASVPPGLDPSSGSTSAAPGDREDYDPWAPFNERTFRFNHQLDRFVMKPAATAWDKALPDPVQRSLKNAFTNVAMPKRFVNSILQLKVAGAARELGRFVLNSTIGIAGFFDIAKAAGVAESNEDTGQTLGRYGVGPGPYLVLPFLPPMTVRDGVGFAIDSLLDPLSYVAPFAANVGMTGTDTINTRAENLEVFEDVEESVLDLYSAVRNGYLQRRQKAIEE